MTLFAKLFNPSPKNEKLSAEEQMGIVNNEYSVKELCAFIPREAISAENLVLIANSLRYHQKFDAAEMTYKFAIQKKSNYEDGYFNLMSLYLLQRNFEGCEEMYHKGRANCESSDYIVFQDGRMQFMKGNYDLALSAMYSVLSALEFQYLPAIALAIHCHLWLVKAKENREENYEKAAQLYQIGKEQYPDSEELKELSKFFEE